MKKTFTLLLLSLFALLPASAQDMGALQGYTNVFIRVKPAIEGTGTVSALPPSGGLNSYKDQVDFQRVLPVAMESVYFTCNARAKDDNVFVGWYLDDGDGVFDVSKDEPLSFDQQATIFIPVALLKGFDEETSLFATEAEAKTQGEQPAEPQAIVFAHFTQSCTIDVDHNQQHCGTVEISNPNNQPGDVVTIKAIPADGYQFEYWKTGYDSQIFAKQRDTSVSSEAEYTFTVKGGERYYAYFSAVDAPVLHFPAEGGWIATSFDKDWILHEQADALVYNAVLADIVTNAEGQSFFNQDDADAWYDNGRSFRNQLRGYGNSATLLYGKGDVRFTHYIPGLGFDRADNIFEWSGNKPYTITDKGNVLGYHVYVFVSSRNAFVKIGTTDPFTDPDAPESVTVPAHCCYICLEGIDIADPITDYIPDIIGMTPADYTKAVAGISDTAAAGAERQQATYDLQGRRVGQGMVKSGLYIRNGKIFTVK